MSAAPGGKATLLSSLVGLEGLVVANEPVRQRLPALGDNVRRWGLGNVVVTAADPAAFGALEGFFDCVVVDAPCSGEGMFRKDPAARALWSENNVALCAARQKRILSDSWKALRPGGTLIYSTCTFNRDENEANVAWLVSQFECEGVEVGPVEGVGVFHFYPGMVPGEGFFAMMARKTGRGGGRHASGNRGAFGPGGRDFASARRAASAPVAAARRNILSPLSRAETDEARRWVNQPEHMTFVKIGPNIFGYYAARMADIRRVAESLPALYSGVMMGQVYGGRLKPEHPLALFHDLRREEMVSGRETAPDFAVTELEREAALDYLRMRELDPAIFCEGINLVCFNGFPLGWTKRIKGRVNSLLPKELRIRDL